jgi:hypothetical protein
VSDSDESDDRAGEASLSRSVAIADARPWRPMREKNSLCDLALLRVGGNFSVIILPAVVERLAEFTDEPVPLLLVGQRG